MKQRLFMLIALLCCTMLSAQCSEDSVEAETDRYTIGFETEVKDIAWDSTEAVLVKVLTEDPQWTLAFVDEADREWLSAAADRLSSQVRIRAKSINEQPDMRTALLEVSTAAGNSKARITVNQLGTGPVLKISDPTPVTLERKGGEISFILTANVAYEMIKPEWVETTESEQSEPGGGVNYRFSVSENTTGKTRTGEIEFRSKQIEPELKAALTITQKARLDLEIPEDICFKPTYAQALNDEYEPGYGIDRSIDGDPETNYHSRFGGTHFPVELEYEMPSTADRVDYISYLPPAVGNGAFGQIEVWANTRTSPQLVKMVDFDCKLQRGEHIVRIPNGIEWPGKFRIVVKSGGADFAVCSEMAFCKYADPNKDLEEAVARVFKSQACMELKDGYTQQDLERLPSSLSDIAEKMRNGTYPLEFRCSSYAAYTDPTVWGIRNVTKPFSPLDNPMGIEVAANKPFQVLVGDMHGNAVQILNVTDGAIAGERYPLREGINEFTATAPGQLFVQYFVDDPSAAESKPIEIHVVESESTRVIGYFDLQKHKTAAELERLLRLPDPQTDPGIFTVLGTRVQWNFLKTGLLQNNTPAGILEALKIWDDMVRWFWEVSGMDAPQFPAVRNNRQLAISIVDEGSYMSSNDYFIVIESRSVPERINKNTMFRNRDMMWGPAHEFGHQLDTPITWNGQYESSNNFFSNLATWNLNRYYGSPAITYGPGLWAMMQYTFDERRNFMAFETKWNEETQKYEFDDPGMFLKPRIYWSLYVYYHLVGKDPTFMPRMFEYMRKQNKLSDPQQQSMHFYKNFCDFAKMDFTEYFQCYGWFNPIDMIMTQYGVAHHLLTEEMAAEAQAYVKRKGYPKAPPIQYIDDRKEMDYETARWAPIGDVGYYETFAGDLKVSPDVRYSISGEDVIVEGGEHAVGYEIRNAADSLIYISVYHRFDAGRLRQPGNRLFAVQADGQRIEIAEK